MTPIDDSAAQQPMCDSHKDKSTSPSSSASIKRRHFQFQIRGIKMRIKGIKLYQYSTIRGLLSYCCTLFAASISNAIADEPPAAEPAGVSVVAPATSNQDAMQLDTVKVTADRPGYKTDQASIGAKIDIPLKDVPQSVTVIDSELLKDIAPRVIDEVADYVAGVSREAVQSNPYAISFFFRGFNTAGSASTFNGFHEDGFETPQSSINIERIEFLKGPASVLYGGGGALSGLVNIVTKQPLANAQRELTAGGGSFEHQYSTLDATGPINSNKSLRYRLTAAYDKDGDFVYGAYDQSLFVSPYLSWNVDAATRIDLELSDQDIRRPGRESGFLRYPDFFKLPVRIQLGDPGVPDGDGGTLTSYAMHAEITHIFDNGWKLREGLFGHNLRSNDTTVQVIGYDPDTTEAQRRVRNVNAYGRERDSQTELSGSADTFGLAHQWLGGFEVVRQTSGSTFLVAPYSSIDIFDPQYPGEQTGDIVPDEQYNSGTRTLAGYVQDLVTLPADFKLMVGVRYDRLTSFVGPYDGAPESSQNDTAASPRAGLIWQPHESQSYYLSWTRSFAPNVGQSESGSVFAPERGTQYELGAKFDLAPRLSFSTALFRYRLRNVLAPDPNDPTDTYSIAVGEQRSEGFEAELTGRVMRDWDVVGSYTYLNATVTKDTSLPVGDRLTGVPRNEIGIFNKLGLRALGVPELAVTLGISFASDRESGLPNDPDGSGPLTADDVKLPSYTEISAGLIWDKPAYTLRFNGRNLSNEKIYDGYYSSFQPRAPRSVDASLAVRF
jgi:iron complex outermembrane receptor protein